jgi:hypothetical protein
MLRVGEYIEQANPIMEHFKHDFPGCRCNSGNDKAHAAQDIDLPSNIQLVWLN